MRRGLTTRFLSLAAAVLFLLPGCGEQTAAKPEGTNADGAETAGTVAEEPVLAAVRLDQGALAENDTDKTNVIVSDDGASFAVETDDALYSGVKVYYISSETRERVVVDELDDGYLIPDADTALGRVVYVQPLRKSVTVSVQPHTDQGKWAGANLELVSVENPVFDEAGRLTGYDSLTPLGQDSVEASDGEYVFYTVAMDPGYEVKVNIAPHQIVALTAKDAAREEFIAYSFFDYDHYAYDSVSDVTDSEYIALNPGTEISKSYGTDTNSFIYQTNAADCERPSVRPYELYYIKISADTVCWEEREPVKALTLDTLRDLVLGAGGSPSDVEIALDADTLSPETVVTVIDTDNNNRENMGNLEYKGYSTEDSVDGVEGNLYTNWIGTTFAGNRNGGAAFTPVGWTENPGGAAQFRCGEGVQVSVSDPEDYTGIRVYYVDDSGEEIPVDVTDEPFLMYEADGQTQSTPEAAPGVWYFRCPMVTLSTADHLTLSVAFLP